MTANSALIITIGNALCGDDGFGSAVAEQLRSRRIESEAILVCCHQLTPELSEDIQAASKVVFVDARADFCPGEVDIRQINAAPDSRALSALAHQVSPEALLGLTRELFQKVPQAFAVTIGAKQFEPGADLSDCVREKIDEVCDRIEELLVTNTSIGTVHA